MSRLYQVVYSDPPWRYTNKKTGGSMISGAASKYATLSTDEICALKPPVDRFAVCYLWVTVPFLPDGLRVLQAYGFKYKTMLTWRKIMCAGMGYWYRGQTEHLLFGVRGKVPAFRMQVPNFYESRAGKHSEKPAYFRQMIERSVEQSFAAPPKLEMFARTASTGWDVHGLEVPNAIILQP